MIENFFKPKSVAIIGASGNKNKVGYSLVSNLIGKETKVYPVSLKEKEILGLEAFSKVSEISDSIDLAVIAVPAANVPEVLEDCGKKQVPNVIIVSSGFRETGSIGKELEDRIITIAEENNIKVLGPNCLGLIDANSGFNASFSAQMPLPGKIALLSQSGALGTAMIDWANNEKIGFSKFISLGNEALLSEIDFLKFLENDPDTQAILIYIEKINAGREFIDLVKSITVKKPVVVLKAGVSDYGASAIMSHTGSLAPESKVFAAALKQSGAITVPSLRKFFNMAKLLSLEMDVNNPVKNLVILTNGGGPSVIAADEIGISNSLTLAKLDEDTKNKLRSVLPGMASVGNPVDIIGDALADRYEKALQILSEVQGIQGIILMLTPQMMTESEATARMLQKFKSASLPKIFPVFIGGSSVESGRRAMKEMGIVNFSFTKDVITGLDDLAAVHGFGKAQETKSRQTENRTVAQMPFSEAARILSDYNIFISGKFVIKKEDLSGALDSLNDGFFVMKAFSPDIVHKTEAGAVVLNIKSKEEAEKVWDEIYAKNPNSNIEGILVQKMEQNVAGGREVIIGMKRDETFGPAILFGLGGIFAEAIKDTTLYVAPIEKEEALKMMQEIKGIKILKGLRGEPPVNFDLLADIIVNLSRLALEHPEIREIDLNPVMATANSATIVDARVMI